jgi:hypothetical protein
MIISAKIRMKSNKGTHIPELNGGINHGERNLKWGSSYRPLGLLEKRLDAVPSHSKISFTVVTYMQELISFIFKHNFMVMYWYSL